MCRYLDLVTSPVVVIENLGKRYGPLVALAGLDLSVRPGEVLGLLGPNGAGKTTTLRLLMGFIRPTTGRASLFGMDAWSDSATIHRNVGYLAGTAKLYPRWTGRELMSYLARLQEMPVEPPVQELAKRFELDLDRPIGTLSKGNQQKVALLQAFMGRPQLLILDEPTSGLDPLLQQEFAGLVREVADEGAAVILSSHVLSEVQQVADWVAILRGGKLIVSDRLEDLRAQAAHEVTVRFAEPPAADAFVGVPGVDDAVVEGSTLHCTVHGAIDPLIKALAQHKVLSLSSKEADLEEVFLTMYGRETVR